VFKFGSRAAFGRPHYVRTPNADPEREPNLKLNTN